VANDPDQFNFTRSELYRDACSGLHQSAVAVPARGGLIIRSRTAEIESSRYSTRADDVSTSVDFIAQTAFSA